MDVELQATCSALGFLEGTEYIKEPDCLETVKDLIRFLRHDTDVCDIRRQLGHAQILQTDLIPLIKVYHKDKALFDTVIKLMVNLTQPVITCFNNEIPDEKTLRNNCLEVEGYLQDYKEAFINEGLFNVLAEKMQDILKLDWDERREEDKLQLERLFVLIRNILMVPSNPDREQRTEDDASIHDQILWTMHITGMEDLILYVASSDRERSMLCMHIMEIIFLMFKEQEVQTLVSAGVQRSITEKEKDQKELEQAREKERAQRKAIILKFSARHSRFGGTYIIKNMKSISENDVIYHKPLCEMGKFSLDAGKVQKKMARNRAPIKTETTKRRSTLSMRLSLKEFCVQFLVNAYNPLMRAVKDALTRKTTQDNDETYYLWAMRFFMQFCRFHCKRVDLISETMSLPAFHYIYTQLCTYYENIRLGKGEECKIWGTRTHLALKAYQELLNTLDFMCKSDNTKIRESAKIIQSNVFYMVEYRDVFVTLIKNFQESKCSRAYLRDLVESTHVFLKMLEGFVQSSRHLVVQKKKQKRKSKKSNIARDSEPREEDLETNWNEHISSQLLTVLQSEPEALNAVSPFDAASDMNMEEQRVEAMLKIQMWLREKNLVDAVSMFHAAREVWPERDEFGSEQMSVEEELIALQEIFMANLQQPQPPQSQHSNEDEPDNDIDEEERNETLTCETEFDFKLFINDFAHQDLIKNYAILLAEFANNSDFVNHCIVKMLHRISHDLGYVGMLFQASVFRTFNSLLQGQYSQQQKYQELAKFACYVVRQFTSIAKINKRVYIDLLFWKSKNEVLAITGDYDFSQKSKVKMLWTEHQEQELQTLYEKYRDVIHPDLDLVELIQGELTSSHSRLQILRELKKQGLITSARDVKKKCVRLPKWTEDEMQKLNDAFQTHCKSDYPISEIMKTLKTDKSKRVVIAKLIDLGLVHDKKQLLKQKRSRVGGRNQDVVSGGEEESTLGETNNRSKSGRKKRKLSSEDDDFDYEEGENEEDDEGMQQLIRQSASTIGDCVCNLIKKGYNSQLVWIIRGLRNAAEDRQDGVFVPTPLVPLTEENEIAMEDNIFLAFLHSLGITSPVSDQEMFWRIPAEYCAADLLKIAGCLELHMSGQVTDGDDIQRIISTVFPKLSAGINGHDRKSTRHKTTGNVIKTKTKLSQQKFVKSMLLNDENSNLSQVDDRDIEHASQNSNLSQVDDIDIEHASQNSNLSQVDDRDIEHASQNSNLSQIDDIDIEHASQNSNLSQVDDIDIEHASQNSNEQELEQSDIIHTTSSPLPRLIDSSDSDMDPEIEAIDEEIIRVEKQTDSSTKLKAELRRCALLQMMEAKKMASKSKLRSLSAIRKRSGKSIKTEKHMSVSVKKRMHEADSDSNDSHSSLKQVEGEGPQHTKMSKRFRRLSSEDEDDDDNVESKESFPATLFTQDLESDDEDDHVPLRAAVRKRKAVIDDDDDE